MITLVWFISSLNGFAIFRGHFTESINYYTKILSDNCQEDCSGCKELFRLAVSRCAKRRPLKKTWGICPKKAITIWQPKKHTMCQTVQRQASKLLELNHLVRSPNWTFLAVALWFNLDKNEQGLMVHYTVKHGGGSLTFWERVSYQVKGNGQNWGKDIDSLCEGKLLLPPHVPYCTVEFDFTLI